MVKKVGDKRYWEQWAASVADIAKRHIDRITRLISKRGEHRATFDAFLADLRKNIYPAVTDAEAVECLHTILLRNPSSKRSSKTTPLYGIIPYLKP